MNFHVDFESGSIILIEFLKMQCSLTGENAPTWPPLINCIYKHSSTLSKLVLTVLTSHCFRFYTSVFNLHVT